MGDAAISLARELVRATSTSLPVQAHRFALETGFNLTPIAGVEPMLFGDELRFDGAMPWDDQEDQILELIARWTLQRCSEPVTPAAIVELLRVWITSSCEAELASSEEKTRA